MVKKFSLIILLIFTGMVLSSCIVSEDAFKKTQNDVYYLQSTTTRINQRLSNLEKRVVALENNYKSLEKNQISIKAQQSLKFNEVFTELQSIKNQINDLSSFSRKEGKPANGPNEVTQEAIKDIYSRLNDIEQEVSNLKSSVASEETNSTTAVVKDDKYYYKEAYKLFASGKYSEAQNKFTAFISNFKKSPLIPNAYYWLGECYFKMKMYDKAIINYDEVIVKFPRHAKVPAALLKEGIAFLKIGEKDGARLIFKRIIQDFPRSNQAKYARNYLKRLK